MLACHNYESVFKELPGYAGESNPIFVDFRLDRKAEPALTGGTWITQALFFMEQGQLALPLAKLSGDPSVVPTPEVEHIVRVPVQSLNCPTRRDAKAYPLINTYAQRYGELGARTDYAMNAGPAIVSEVDNRNITNQGDGAWVMGKRVKSNRVFDGLSYTYLLGEKAMDSMRYTTGDCFGDRAPLAGWTGVNGTSHSYVRYAARQPQLDTVRSCLVCHDFGSASGWMECSHVGWFSAVDQLRNGHRNSSRERVGRWTRDSGVQPLADLCQRPKGELPWAAFLANPRDPVRVPGGCPSFLSVRRWTIPRPGRCADRPCDRRSARTL